MGSLIANQSEVVSVFRAYLVRRQFSERQYLTEVLDHLPAFVQVQCARTGYGSGYAQYVWLQEPLFLAK
jgi:hypothetical protein